jgi:anti-sigma28 factor (negative regulator of flagellin synthesis)
MTAMQAAQQLSDYIKCGFEIKFESPQVAAQWNEKRIYTPDDESPIEVAPIVVDVSKGLMDDEILVTRIMQTTNQLNKNIRVFQLGETFKSKFDVLAKEKGNDEIIQSFTKNIVTPIDKENERKRKSKSEETPAVASQKEVVELKKAIAQGKLSTINSDKLAKTLEKLQQHPEAFVVKLSAPDPRMTGMEAAQKLSDYISCGFEISFSSPQTIEQWKKLINPEVGDIFAIKVNEFEGLKDDLLLMNRAANGVKVLLENGFKVVHVSEAYYEKLKDNTLNDEGVSQLLQNPLFVQLATVTGKVTPPPQPTRTSSAEKSVETSALQAEEISPRVATIGQQPASTPQPRPRAASTSKAEQPLSPKKQLNRSKSFSGPLELPAAKVDVPEEPLPISRSASEVSLVQPSSKSVAVVVPASQTKAPPEPPKKEKRVLVQPESAPLLLSKLPQASIRLNTRNPQPKINIFDENQIKTFIKDLKAYRDSINTKKQDSFLHKLGMGKLEERSLQAGGLITALENSLESKDLSEVKESLLEVKRQIKNWRLPEKIYGKSQLQEKVDVIIHQLGLQEPEKNKKNTPNGSGA